MPTGLVEAMEKLPVKAGTHNHHSLLYQHQAYLIFDNWHPIEFFHGKRKEEGRGFFFLFLIRSIS
jgi:hypothetical protein